MTGFVEVAVIAAVAQLAVLPGEKVQFIIAGLSARYDPKLVVAAAGAAFAGWTAVEIAVGEAVQRTLPGVVLDAFTGALFLVFAVLLVRSAPGRAETDGGLVATQVPDQFEPKLLGRPVEGPVGQFLAVFVMMAAGEFGDKTQIVTIGLAAQFGATPAIWVGEMAAIVPVSLANAYFFHKFAHRVDLRLAHYAGAALFLLFGADTWLSVATGFSAWEWAVGRAADVVLGLL